MDRKIKAAAIVIDGACVDILMPWVRDNRLPNFRKLFADGCSADLLSEFPPVTFLNNPSMLTGMNVGNHGIINWLQRKGDSLEVVDSRSIEHKFVWDILAEHGHKSIVMNIPLTHPPRKMDGIMLSRSVVPPLSRGYVYPPELEKELAEKVGEYQVFQQEIYGEGKDEKFYKSICDAVEKRLSAALYLIKEHPWSLFILGFSCVDAVQHAYWRYVDKDHPRYDEKKALKYGRYIFDIYKKMDDALGEISRALDDDTVLMVLSDHGAGPLYGRTHTNNLLMDLGLLKFKRNPVSKLKYRMFKMGLTMQNLYKLAIVTGLVNLRKKADPRSKGKSVIRKLFLSWNDIDWSRTSAVVLGTGGQIYLNPAAGARSPEALRDYVKKELLKIRIPSTGEAFVAKVYDKGDLYWGTKMDGLPDMLFLPADDRYEESGDYEFYSNRHFDSVWGISCNHRRNALFVVKGRGIRQGQHLEKQLRMYDIAAVLLSIFGIEVPASMDGKAVKEMYDAVG